MDRIYRSSIFPGLDKRNQQLSTTTNQTSSFKKCTIFDSLSVVGNSLDDGFCSDEHGTCNVFQNNDLSDITNHTHHSFSTVP